MFRLNVTIESLSRIPLDKVRKAARSGDRLSTLELILRSPIAGKSEVTKEEAVRICEDELKRESDQDVNFYFYHLVLGLHAWEAKKYESALQHLNIITKVGYPQHALINGQAEYALAKLQLQLNDYRQAAAWLTRAILLGSEEARKHFLDNTFLHPTTILPPRLCNTFNQDKKHSTFAILECMLLAFILSGKRFEGFSDSTFVKYWNETTIQTFTAANQSENALQSLQTNDSPIAKLAAWTISGDQYQYFNFFKYCFANQIISADIYFEVMDFFLKKATDPRLKNKAAYTLYQISLKRAQPDKAAAYLNQIDPAFFTMANKKFSEIHAGLVTMPEEHKLIIVNRLYAARHYKEVLLIIKEIKDFEKIKIDLQECRKKAMHSAILECVILLESYIKDRQSRVKEHPIRFIFGDLLLKNGKERAAFVDEFKKKAQAGRNDILFLEEILKTLRQGNAQFPAGSTGEMEKAFQKAEVFIVQARECVAALMAAERIASKLGTDTTQQLMSASAPLGVPLLYPSVSPFSTTLPDHAPVLPPQPSAPPMQPHEAVSPVPSAHLAVMNPASHGVLYAVPSAAFNFAPPPGNGIQAAAPQQLSSAPAANSVTAANAPPATYSAVAASPVTVVDAASLQNPAAAASILQRELTTAEIQSDAARVSTSPFTLAGRNNPRAGNNKNKKPEQVKETRTALTTSM